MLGLGLTLWPNRGPAGTGGGGGGGGYRYWRIFMLNNNGDPNYLALNEVELRGSVGGADLTSPITPVAASTYNAAYDPQYTVDNSLGTTPLWISAQLAVANQWLRYDLGTPTALAQVAMCFTEASWAGRSPKDLRIEGSNDGTNFTTVKTFLGNTSWPYGGVFKVFDL